MNKTALIVVDMVYDFADPKGLVYYEQNREILPNIIEMIKKARENDILIIFMQHSHREHKYDKELTMVRKNCMAGTGGDQLIPELGYDEKTDYLIKKRRYSSFYGTDLDLVLRENKIENTIICGTKTNCCIRSTVQDAYLLNYNVIVPRECVATNSEVINEVHLTDIHKYFGRVFSLEELFRKIEDGEI